MNRNTLISKLAHQYDVIVIGGGATGLGIAVDAASRGYNTLLLEAHDFAKGTSSRSTKLVHGGVRYLQQGNIKLVMDALRERGVLRKNAPHLVRNQSFIVPNYKWWEGPYYGLGLKVYDWMSGSLGLGTSEWLNTEEVLAKAPTLDPEGLKGGVIYHDGQFDDSRLAINLAQTAAEQGATVLNYCRVTGFIKTGDRLSGVHFRDELNQEVYSVQAKAVVNATGVYSDRLQQLDDPHKPASISPSQGIHLVLDKKFLPGESAIMIPHTDDGRVLFAVPWHDRIILGTTDTPVSTIEEEPKAKEEEISFLLTHAARYLTHDPERSDILSVFAGLRPLVKATAKKTAELSRDHTIQLSASGLISVLGGKWTTYRKMAEDAVNSAAVQGQLPYAECRTNDLPIHGAEAVNTTDSLDYYYGSDRTALAALRESEPGLAVKLNSRLPYTMAEIVWAVRHECCMTVEDALSRRTRALLLDAKAALESTPAVATVMAKELGKDQGWIDAQILSFNTIAGTYLPA